MELRTGVYSQPLLALGLFILPLVVRGLGFGQILLGLFLAYLVYFFDSSQYEPGRRYHPRIYNWIRNADARMLSGYFQKVSLNYEDFGAIEKQPQVIYSIQPHGVMSFCPPMLFMNAPQKTCGLGASVCFKFPIMREMYLWMGVIDAGRRTCMKALKEGYSLSIVLGGTKEQLIPYSPTHDTIVCKSRRGFIYLARDAGKIPIVPCYCFGEQIAYETSNFMLSTRQWLQQHLGLGLPLPKSWRPKHLKDFALVVGKPIEWEEDDTVTTMHDKYVSAIRDLFYDNKSKYPEYEKRELVIEFSLLLLMAFPLHIRSQQDALALALFLAPTLFKGVGFWQLACGLLLSYSVYLMDSSQYEPHCRYNSKVFEYCRSSYTKMLKRFADNVALVYEDESALKQCAQVIYSIHPHGVMSFCHPYLFFNCPHATCGLSASACFKCPLMRELWLALGVIDAGRATCMRALQQGYSLTLVLGGTKEQLIPYSPTHDTIVCKSRRGFIYLARDAGKIPIVPCYCFGEQITYETSDFMLPLRQWLQHNLGLGMPLPKSLRPKHLKDFVVVVGAPLTWGEDDTVETMHAKYVSAVRDLFYKNRERYPDYAKRELVIQ